MFADITPPQTVADLFTRIWQYAYVTTDLDRAIAEMTDELGFKTCIEVPNADATFLAGDAPRPWNAKFAVATSGGPIIEIIEPVAGEVDFYRQALPSDGSYALRLHHMATSVPAGDDEWQRLQSMLGDAGLRIDYTALIPGYVRAGYVDATGRLGHYLEICQHEPEGMALFSELTRAAA